MINSNTLIEMYFLFIYQKMKCSIYCLVSSLTHSMTYQRYLMVSRHGNSTIGINRSIGPWIGALVP